MRTIIATILTVVCALAAAIGLGASPASAATWTVTGSSGAGGAFSTSAATLTLKDTTTGTTITCSLSVAGRIPNATGVSGTGIATITSATFTGCSGPLGLILTFSANFPWQINWISYNPSTGVGVVTVTGIVIRISGTGCAATVTGGAPGTYSNSTATLSLSPTAPNPTGVKLTISGVSGCFGLIGNGHTATLTGSWHLSPSTIRVTSP